MSRKGLNYAEVYDYLKEHKAKETAEKFGSTEKFVTLVGRVGDAVLGRLQDSKPLASYTPRDLMTELANRGYRGKLTYQQVIDISNF